MTTLCTVTRDGRTSRHIEGGTVGEAIGRAINTYRGIPWTINLLTDHRLILHWPCGDETRDYRERT